MDDLEQAVAFQRKSVAINPKLTTPQVFLAGYLAAAGQEDEATALRERVLAEDPGFRIRTVVGSLGLVSEPLREKFASAAAAAGFA